MAGVKRSGSFGPFPEPTDGDKSVSRLLGSALADAEREGAVLAAAIDAGDVITYEPGSRPPELAGLSHRFVQFVKEIAVLDCRGQEVLVARATVGQVFSGSDARKVAAISLIGDWFEIYDEKGANYRVPASNVRSARR